MSFDENGPITMARSVAFETPTPLPLPLPHAQGEPLTGPWGLSTSPALTTARAQKSSHHGKRLIPKTADPDLK